MPAFYNELDPYPAAWLRNLIAGGHIAPGPVDERSIRDLSPADVAGPGQRHFFAGIGVWSRILRRAGFGDGANVWTASCPCQPFSSAGQRRGVDDERHLWPVLFELVRECRPAILFGEQVANADGRHWLSAVRADLEGAGYAVGAADLAAAGAGAPHIRQRLWFVAVRAGVGQADTGGDGREDHDQAGPAAWSTGGGGADGGLADADPTGRSEQRRSRVLDGERTARGHDADRRGEVRRMGDAGGDGARQHPRELPGDEGEHGQRSAHGHHASIIAGPTLPGPWADAEYILCSDGKARPAQPGAFPLAHGTPARVGRLRAYGNALCEEVGVAFATAARASLAV